MPTQGRRGGLARWAIELVLPNRRGPSAPRLSAARRQGVWRDLVSGPSDSPFRLVAARILLFGCLREPGARSIRGARAIAPPQPLARQGRRQGLACFAMA